MFRWTGMIRWTGIIWLAGNPLGHGVYRYVCAPPRVGVTFVSVATCQSLVFGFYEQFPPGWHRVLAMFRQAVATRRLGPHRCLASFNRLNALGYYIREIDSLTRYW